MIAVALLHRMDVALLRRTALDYLFECSSILERVELRTMTSSLMLDNPRYPEGAYKGIVYKRGEKYEDGVERMSWNAHWYLGF